MTQSHSTPRRRDMMLPFAHKSECVKIIHQKSQQHNFPRNGLLHTISAPFNGDPDLDLGGGWQSRSDRRQIGTLDDAILEGLEKVLLLQRCREVANLEKIPPTLHLSCLLSCRMMQQRVQWTEANCELRLHILLILLFFLLCLQIYRYIPLIQFAFHLFFLSVLED